jgi:hypothetical protein
VANGKREGRSFPDAGKSHPSIDRSMVHLLPRASVLECASPLALSLALQVPQTAHYPGASSFWKAEQVGGILQAVL